MSDTTKEYHPAPETLERFVCGALDPFECRNVVRHLLTDCPVCGKVTRRLWITTEKARRGKIRRDEAPILEVDLR